MINILDKYDVNIKDLQRKVRISPVKYRESKAMETFKWRVYININRNGNNHYKEFKSVYHNGQRITLNNVTDHLEKIRIAELIRNVVRYKIETSPLFLVVLVHGKKEANRLYPYLFKEPKKASKLSIKDAFEESYSFKKNDDIKRSHLLRVRSMKNRFLKEIDGSLSIDRLDQKMCVDFLNKIGAGNSNATLNNNKAYLSILLSVLVDKKIITKNWLDDIKKKKVKPKKNKAFSTDQLNLLWKELKKHPVLEFYCMHVYYGLMRNITVSRLKCKDIDLDNNVFNTDTKTGLFDKVITKKLKDEYVKLDLSDPEKYIFGKTSLIENWNVTDDYRRSTYDAMFLNLIKKPLGISNDYGIYSLRHNGIGSFYETQSKELQDQGVFNWHEKTCEIIMQITNHKSIRQVETYLRDINPKMRFDYGKYIN